MRLKTMGLRNKIFFSIVGVILFISAAIALLARGILIKSLTEELTQRGVAIAQSLAEQARGPILDKNVPELVALVFDAAELGDRKHLIDYIFITDDHGEMLAHTFIRPYPEDLTRANLLEATRMRAISETTVFDRPVYDIAVPVTEGIYRIGSVHVGFNKGHIDQLVAKLRITFLGFISLIVVIIFLITLKLTSYITRPLRRLTRLADEISRGNFDLPMEMKALSGGYQLQECPAYRNTDMPCWHFDQARGENTPSRTVPENQPQCRECRFYRRPEQGDEMDQLADSFYNMLWSIKLYRRRLGESEEKYRSMFDSGPDPIFVVGTNTMAILDANPRAAEVYGFDNRDQLIGVSFLELDPDFNEEFFTRYEEAVSEFPTYSYSKLVHYTRDKSPFFVNLNACPISYMGRQAVIIAATDVTETMEKEAQLIQASKMKTLGEMSAGVAHEINQPLNAIKIGSDYLNMMTKSGKEIPAQSMLKVTDEMGVQVERATEIINTLRAFGRKADLTQERCNINKSIQDVLTLAGHQLKHADLRMELDLDEGLPPILAHDNRLQQVLFNLVTNAGDAISQRQDTPPGGHVITIRTFARDGQVVVQIADTGVGIPEKARGKVFEPFYTTKETGQGMGLGLSITYGIVKDYGGDIRIISDENQGTTFILTFPAIKEDR
jgi:histidine kinase